MMTYLFSQHRNLSTWVRWRTAIAAMFVIKILTGYFDVMRGHPGIASAGMSEDGRERKLQDKQTKY